MAVLCARCLHPAAEDERRCPACGEDLFNQPVPLVDDVCPPPSPPRQRRRLISATASQLPPLPLFYRDDLRHPPSLVISRVVGVAPAAAEAALDRWWSAHADRPVIERDHDYLKLGAPLHQPPGRLCRMPAALQHRAHGHRERLELELTPWSASQTELTLRPRRRLHNAVRYFGAAPGLLDRMAELLTGIATGPAGLRMYSLQSEGKFT